MLVNIQHSFFTASTHTKTLNSQFQHQAAHHDFHKHETQGFLYRKPDDLFGNPQATSPNASSLFDKIQCLHYLVKEKPWQSFLL